ncbi:shikimate dehydrogenase [Archaeoglobus neptunius]|uniref:shikimate dehydrogenase n=1 Tax=Archaeoglobus neptunius TaxID=2798580 RepID=UPI0019272DC2|nr:shikimate dehydrogenase [Archaeoglobus neptunius]
MMYLGVIGYPIRHSVSPAMHNAALKKAGIEGVYLAFEVRPEMIKDAIFGARALGFAGLNVTIPFKEEVADFLTLEGHAALLKAVNTVDLREMVGYNTDVYGVKRSFSDLDVGGKTALVVGAGGAGKAAALALVELGATVIITNRTESRGMEAVELIRRHGECIFYPFERVGELSGKVDILVNATPLGMKGFAQALPVPAKILKPGMIVFDTVYNPVDTPLIRSAREAGCRVIYGIEMLVHQGARAFEIWTGIKPDVDVMREAAIKALKNSFIHSA